MIVNFHQEAAKRRASAGRTATTVTDHNEKTIRATSRGLPRVEFGSGWYHSEAVRDSGHIQSHKD